MPQGDWFGVMTTWEVADQRLYSGEEFTTVPGRGRMTQIM